MYVKQMLLKLFQSQECYCFIRSLDIKKRFEQNIFVS